MTYPQYGQPAQGYAPAQPQQYPPQQPMQQPTYPQQQPQYSAPPAQPAPAQMGPSMPAGFTAPPPAGQAYPRPKLSDLRGRLVLIRPTALDRGIKAPGTDPNKLQDRITADIVVLDGGALAFGGSMQQGRPNTHQDPAMPVGYKGVFLSQKSVVTQLQGYLPGPTNPAGGRCLARVGLGTSSTPGNNAPYRLDDPSNEDIALAHQYLAGEQTGNLPFRSTAEPVPGQQAAPMQTGPQYVQTIPQQYAPPAQYGPQQGYAPAQQPQGPPPGYPPMAPQPAPGQFPQYPPQQPGPAGYLANPDPGAQYAPQQQPTQPAPPTAQTPWG